MKKNESSQSPVQGVQKKEDMSMPIQSHEKLGMHELRNEAGNPILSKKQKLMGEHEKNPVMVNRAVALMQRALLAVVYLEDTDTTEHYRYRAAMSIEYLEASIKQLKQL